MKHAIWISSVAAAALLLTNALPAYAATTDKGAACVSAQEVASQFPSGQTKIVGAATAKAILKLFVAKIGEPPASLKHDNITGAVLADLGAGVEVAFLNNGCSSFTAGAAADQPLYAEILKLVS